MLCFGQERLWFLNRLLAGSTAYNYVRDVGLAIRRPHAVAFRRRPERDAGVHAGSGRRGFHLRPPTAGQLSRAMEVDRRVADLA